MAGPEPPSQSGQCRSEEDQSRVGQLVDSWSDTILSQIVESLYASKIVESNSWILKFLSDAIFDQLFESIYRYNYWSQLVWKA